MDQRLSLPQFVFLMIWLVLGTGILTMPFAIGQFVVRDAWISACLFPLGASAIIGVVALFTRTFRGATLIEGVQAAFGPYVGGAVTLWILIVMWTTSSIMLREISLFINNTVMPRTPNFIITLLLILPAAYAVYQGLEVIGRLAEVITPVGIAITVTLYLLAMQHADFSRLQPVLADGWEPVLRGAVVPWGFAAELVFSLLLANSLERGPLLRGLWFASAFISLAGVVAETTITSILGASRTFTNFPILEVVRTIRIGGFVERLDPLYVMGVITTMFLKLSLFHYGLCTALRQWLRLKTSRPVVWPAAAVVWAGSILLVRDAAKFQDLVLFGLWGYLLFTAFVIPSAAVAVYRLRRHLLRRRDPSTSAKKKRRN
ncbi:MAG: endospore germination permease [Kyrpidia sp.]|nr:endospore germination permease [Kyrpidia sp.]